MVSASEKHQHHVAGGLKAALHNPNVSEQAKDDALQRLERMGEVAGTEINEGPSYDEETNRRLGGYKATLTNDRTSDEAKDHAREVLEAAGIEVNDGHSSSDEHAKRVLAGYKAAIHNPNVSQEAKIHAKQFLREHGESA
ncbi:hypothetical protein FB446DRAFT_834943 [Lentinula raphanica]|nr:hypothetical protein EV360DRAFT_78096 [Lentinula raphanica]KAJ3773861.1 hypothetical protein FB446DRAFT_834943 [Lentinula raphanica]